MRNKRPVTMAVSPDPSIPWVTSSAVERAENPEFPLHPNIHILFNFPGFLSEQEMA